jgi:FlaA1/EpsC-like NDP-sugar epimerase
MFKNLNIIPRWVVFLIDLLVCYFAFIFSHFLKNNLSFQGIDLHTLSGNILVLLFVMSANFIAFKTYDGIIRYTGLQDALKIVYSVVAATALLFILSLFGTLLRNRIQHSVYFSAVILIINLLFTTIFLIGYRLVVKSVFAYLQYHKLDKKSVIIYGAGDAGFATKRVLEHDYSSNIKVAAFIDDDVRKVDKVVDGVRIFHSKELAAICEAEKVDEVIMADFTITPARKNEVVNFCLDNNIKVLNVPPVDTWINGQFSSRQLRTLEIENLLERDAIKLSNEELGKQLQNRRILVTGAAGSIGSEIVRQLLKYHPQLIVLCDQAETPLHQLELELENSKTPPTRCIPYLCDITNEARMKELFRKYQPEYVYHAAAYKHVPMMEICAAEAVLNNTMGTKMLADLSLQHKVKRFVFVSTDKAVNPTNVMGSSKRLAEVYIQYLHHISQEQSTDPATRFIITRFGNVLGTNGSVVGIFKDQIERGGPVTVTHPDITRFFMTIPEACQLVLEAGSMGKGGEIFVFDMGESVSIVELAKKMIRLYGLVPGTDIEIRYSGLRPGEKLYEELWTGTESLLPTHHEKIMIASHTKPDAENIRQSFDALISLAKSGADDMLLVAKMKELVPEFLSNNSVFEELDN